MLPQDLVELLSKQLTTLCQLGWQRRYYSLGISQSTNLLDYILPLDNQLVWDGI